MTCPHCHAPLTTEARFCPACGKATSSTQSGSSWPVAASTPEMIGREIAGRYRIVKKLGEGGMGAVYRGEQISLKRAVAVKLLRPELGSNQMVLRRFNAEAEAVAKLSHPNTVNIYDFGQDTDGSLFIAMEYIEGRSLREALQKEGAFSATRAITIALQVAASLSDAHAHSIVHRDLKPDNVMLQDRGRQRDVVRVLDFGIAKLRDDNRATQQAMTQAGDMLGTPQYMAPEQIRGETIDGRTDIYALGCMIYEMVTARLPYEAPTIMAMLSKHLVEPVVPPSQRRPDLAIPPAIDQLVLHAMAKDPAARPPTMELFSEMLQSLLAQLPADPNRSAGMSVQQGIVTPVAPSAFGPPAMPPPLGAPMSPVGGSPMTPPAGSPMSTPMPPVGGSPMSPVGGSPMTPVGGSPMTPPAGSPISPPMSPPPIASGADTFPPPMTPPPGFMSASFGAPSGPAPTANVRSAPTPTGRASNRAPLYIVLAVLALGGAGAGVYFAMREDPSDAGPKQPDPWDQRGSAVPDPWQDGSAGPPSEAPDEDPEPPEPDPADEPPSNKPDPWSGTAPSGRSAVATVTSTTPPRAARIGTAQTPIPAGAKLVVGAGFTSVVNDDAHLYVNATRGISIALAPLVPGTNEPDELADLWATSTGVTKTGTMKVTSAGKQRDAVGFAGTGPDGNPVNQIIVVYIEPAYRLGVLYQAPSTLFADAKFEREVMGFFASNVVLPSGSATLRQ